jgi:hypothetical protein
MLDEGLDVFEGELQIVEDDLFWGSFGLEDVVHVLTEKVPVEAGVIADLLEEMECFFSAELYSLLVIKTQCYIALADLIEDVGLFELTL